MSKLILHVGFLQNYYVKPEHFDLGQNLMFDALMRAVNEKCLENPSLDAYETNFTFDLPISEEKAREVVTEIESLCHQVDCGIKLVLTKTGAIRWSLKVSVPAFSVSGELTDDEMEEEEPVGGGEAISFGA